MAKKRVSREDFWKRALEDDAPLKQYLAGGGSITALAPSPVEPLPDTEDELTFAEGIRKVLPAYEQMMESATVAGTAGPAGLGASLRVARKTFSRIMSLLRAGKTDAAFDLSSRLRRVYMRAMNIAQNARWTAERAGTGVKAALQAEKRAKEIGKLSVRARQTVTKAEKAARRKPDVSLKAGPAAAAKPAVEPATDAARAKVFKDIVAAKPSKRAKILQKVLGPKGSWRRMGLTLGAIEAGYRGIPALWEAIKGGETPEVTPEAVKAARAAAAAEAEGIAGAERFRELVTTRRLRKGLGERAELEGQRELDAFIRQQRQDALDRLEKKLMRFKTARPDISATAAIRMLGARPPTVMETIMPPDDEKAAEIELYAAMAERLLSEPTGLRAGLVEAP